MESLAACRHAIASLQLDVLVYTEIGEATPISIVRLYKTLLPRPLRDFARQRLKSLDICLSNPTRKALEQQTDSRQRDCSSRWAGGSFLLFYAINRLDAARGCLVQHSRAHYLPQACCNERCKYRPVRYPLRTVYYASIQQLAQESLSQLLRILNAARWSLLSLPRYWLWDDRVSATEPRVAQLRLVACPKYTADCSSQKSSH